MKNIDGCLDFRFEVDGFCIFETTEYNNLDSTQQAIDSFFAGAEIPCDCLGMPIDVVLDYQKVATIVVPKPDIIIKYKNSKELEYDLF